MELAELTVPGRRRRRHDRLLPFNIAKLKEEEDKSQRGAGSTDRLSASRHLSAGGCLMKHTFHESIRVGEAGRGVTSTHPPDFLSTPASHSEASRSSFSFFFFFTCVCVYICGMSRKLQMIWIPSGLIKGLQL